MRAWPVLFLAGACTHHRPIADVSSVAGKDVIVETNTGVDVEVTAEQASDGLTFRSATGYMDSAVVTRVVERRHGRGALEGLGIGVAIGFVTGAVGGYVDGDDECENDGHCFLVFTAESKAVILGTFFGLVGGAVGGLIGLVRGSRYVYSYGEQVRVIPSGPPGSVGGVTVEW